MTTQIIRTKLHRPPPTTDLVCRARLHERMDRGLRGPLTLVSAPAGYGKTVLVSHWLESRKEPHAWLSLDESDSNLERFVGYFVAAARTVFPDAFPNTLALLESPSSAPMSALAGTLANELDAIDTSFVLVLDDYHRIDNREVHELLGRLLQHPAQQLHLVIATRRDPPLPLSPMLARSAVTEVRLQDLMFTVPETATFLKRALDLSVSDHALDNVQNELEGWAAGLHLVSLTLRHQDDPESFLSGLHGGVRQVQDYLLREVLTGQPPAMRDCLMKTSILDRFCAPLAEALCAPEHEDAGSDLDGRTFVRALEANNLFCIALDETSEWFRYHHLFQWLLQARLRLDSTAHEIATLHSRASEWYESQGLVEEAISHALAAGDVVAAAEIFERTRHAEQDADRWRTMERWLALFPMEIKENRPGLLLARAWVSHDRYELPQIDPTVQRLKALLDDDAADQLSVGELKFFQGVLLFWQGQGDSSLQNLLEARKRIPSTHPRMRGLVEIYVALARQMAGQGSLAARELEEQLRDGNSLSGALLSRLYLSQALMHSVSGVLTASAEAARLVEAQSQKIAIEYMHGWGLYMQACSLLRCHDLDAALPLFHRAVDKRYLTHTRSAVDSLLGLALTYQAMQRPDAVAETSRLLLDFAVETEDPGHLSIAESGLARLSLAQGDLKSAARWARSWNEEPNVPGLFIWLENPSVTRARVLIALGSESSLEQATILLSRLRSATEAIHNICQTMEILPLQSVALAKQGRPDEAFRLLEQALALAEPRGWILPFVEAGPTMADLLRRAMREGAHGDYAREILAAFGARASAAVGDAGRLVEPLTVREEEVLELLEQRLRDKEIADKLCISTETVKFHARHIYQKLGVSNRREAVAKARSLGLLVKP